MPARSPNMRAHASLSPPAGRPGGNASSYSRSRNSASLGSSRARNDFGGGPPHAFEYIALWPAAQTQRTIFFESPPPLSTAGMKSANSAHVAAASKTSGATLRQCQIFDHHHSDEYVPPIGDSSSGACAFAISVIAAASAADVWSFHSHACAARLLCHFGDAASGRAGASSGIGVDPVVSTPVPITRSRANDPSASASFNAPATATRSPSM